MKKIKYGEFKFKVIKIGEKILSIRNGGNGLTFNKQRILHLNNTSLRENFNIGQRYREGKDIVDNFKRNNFDVKGIGGV
jgi:hypothetical protein